MHISGIELQYTTLIDPKSTKDTHLIVLRVVVSYVWYPIQLVFTLDQDEDTTHYG